MAQFVFTMYCPASIVETKEIIKRVANEINAKGIRENGNIITAKWRYKARTVFLKKFTFYIGEEMVRATTDMYGEISVIGMGRRPTWTPEFMWDMFISKLCELYPQYDFGVKPGYFTLDAIKFMTDGTEQVFTSTASHSPSYSGAILGGMLFGTAGAIIGGMGGKTYTNGRSEVRFSKELLAKARYTNGLNIEGIVIKDSMVYNDILANMNLYNKTE